mmetsp:Transcript_31953/g.39177  ORF Transcript_31953/g.39177 Transcript_31953/m.39177 type:complete len:620 (+) Transcript_31953:147-2006(+)|eukprot:CAMPEP_0172486444 /NCGR_PEP_ID=MMETSP1066-20121228/15028_1 /TAXON_ID=671091 /ORGANISM="Coscinodiscus wailesii, Strain CCMP2513" /LENGTH=619 /DNA_ID=CAMNT_0013252413 /DNA_START=146 /DNA_END=2005 /DNA_ORIENTATION=+
MASSYGLRDLVQKRLIEEVLKPSGEKWPGWMIMVVDKPGMRMVSSVLGMYDLMENRVTIVESLNLKRAPFSDQGVIYLAAPTEESVDSIIKDWDGEKKLYGNAAFLYFINTIPDHLLKKIKNCKPLLKRVKAFGEINIDFLAKESCAFSFDMRDSFKEMFTNTKDKSTKSEEIAVSRLVTVCATLNEYPYVRYRSDAKLSKRMAKLFNSKMNAFVSANPTWWYNGDKDHKARERSTLLMLDRTVDCLTPLMHEFTYQAMVNDLLPIQDDKIKYKADNASSSDEGGGKGWKEVLLDEKDSLWVDLRGKHIADVIQTLSVKIKDIVGNSAGAALSNDGGASLSLSEMGAAMKALPEYQEIMSKMSQHMHLAHQCMNKFTKFNLNELAELEQTLATGTTEEGTNPSLSELIEQVLEFMPKIKQISRIRLLAILIVSQKGISDEDRTKLFEKADLEDYQEKILNNLTHLGVETTQKAQTTSLTTFFTGKKLVASGRTNQESEYAGCRYVPPLKANIEDIIGDRLSFDEYPSVVPMPPGKTSTASSIRTRSVRPQTRAKSVGKKTKTFQGPRVIVFIAGGMCYSELRSGYECMGGSGEREVIMGSTAFVNPSNFVEDLASLAWD